MTDTILTTDDLRRISGKQQPAAIERWLRERGISYIPGPPGPCTTLAAVNARLGVQQVDAGYGAEVAG